MAAGRVNHQQAVGNGGRPAPHHPGNMWTEGLSTADRPQKKKNDRCISSRDSRDLKKVSSSTAASLSGATVRICAVAGCAANIAGYATNVAGCDVDVAGCAVCCWLCRWCCWLFRRCCWLC